MARWEEIATTQIPQDGGELRLLTSNDDFAIRITGQSGDLMNSRMHSSEDALATLACEPFERCENARVLIGGLGMGFTLAAALGVLPATARVVVAELVPGVVDWNRGPLADLAGRPLDDSRVQIETKDVARLIRRARKPFHAIMLDVDNGPEGLTHEFNDQLYSLAGLGAAFEALVPNGLLAVWSAGVDARFTSRLKKIGFDVSEKWVRAHKGKGARHLIWLARRPK